MSTIILTIKLTVYIIAGYGAVRLGIVSKDFHKQLSALMLSIPLPCLILRSFYTTELTDEALSQFGSMMLATAVTLAILFVIGYISKRLMRVPSEAVVCEYGMMTSNFTFFGMPLVETLFGAEGLFYYTIFTTLARVIYYGCPPYMLGSGAKTTLREFIRQMCCPTIGAVVLGFVMYFGRIQPPDAVDDIIQGLAVTGTPFGMMLCGMTLATAPLREAFTRPSVFVLSLVHLLICPAAVMAACMLCGFQPLIIKLAVVYSAMPFGALLPTFATKYCADEHSVVYGSTLVSVSTIICIVTVPMWIYIFNSVL